MARIAYAFTIFWLVSSGVGLHAQQAPNAVATSDPQSNYLFSGDAGLLLFHVHPDRTSDFEAVVARLSDVLGRTTDPVRRQQAESWRIYKSLDPTPDSAVYLFFFDPAVLGADYDPVKVLGEALPAEARELYDRLKAATIRVERVGLKRLR